MAQDIHERHCCSFRKTFTHVRPHSTRMPYSTAQHSTAQHGAAQRTSFSIEVGRGSMRFRMEGDRQ